MRLSVVDTGWPGNVPTLVPALERFGYHRYWTTEHYTAAQSSSPTVLAGIAAGLTTRIRIGTAGVLLNFASPLSVVNDFALLELLYPGRIDMGLVGASGGSVAAAALSDCAARDQNGYQNRLAELVKLRSLACWSTATDNKSAVIGPATSNQPPMWICGSGEASATIAGELGAGYAFHDQLRAPETDGPAVVRAYRHAFKPSLFLSEPAIVVACYGVVSSDARIAAKRLVEHGLKRSSFVGTAVHVGDQLNELAVNYGTEEIAVYLLAESLEESVEGYETLARIFALDENPPTGSNNKKLGTAAGRA